MIFSARAFYFGLDTIIPDGEEADILNSRRDERMYRNLLTKAQDGRWDIIRKFALFQAKDSFESGRDNTNTSSKDDSAEARAWMFLANSLK